MTLDLYTWGTPNGRKVAIMLEELSAAYIVHPVDITKGEQFNPDFLAINPNNKIPVIIDSDGPGGASFTLSESGAMLIYLASKFASSLWPPDEADRAIVLQWLMFQMSAVGPMFGQLHHFRRYATQEAYALERYEKEVHRLYNVIDVQLGKHEYLAGAAYSVADIAVYPWIARFSLHGLGWRSVPNVKRWFDALSARPAVARGMAVPS